MRSAPVEDRSGGAEPHGATCQNSARESRSAVAESRVLRAAVRTGGGGRRFHLSNRTIRTRVRGRAGRAAPKSPGNSCDQRRRAERGYGICLDWTSPYLRRANHGPRPIPPAPLVARRASSPHRRHPSPSLLSPLTRIITARRPHRRPFTAAPSPPPLPPHTPMASKLATSPLSAAPAPPADAITDVLRSVSLQPNGAPADPNQSPLQRARLAYQPRVGPLLQDPRALALADGEATTAVYDEDIIASLFPNLFGQPVVRFTRRDPANAPPCPKKTVAVVLSGGPAPGGHNVICGMFDFIKKLNPQSRLLGFLAGPDGILKNNYIELDDATVAPFRNQGGFHMIGSGRTKIESDEQFAAARETAVALDLDALVIIGGDDSNSNAMKLAENFKAHGVKCCVNGAPKTIDNDLRNAQVEVSFGFDTASKSYAQSTASLAFDAVSARKAYHFIRVMGRSASHIALECALQTHPNLCFIGEEVKQNKITLTDIVNQITDLVCERAELTKNYGVIVLPEGLVEFMPDVEALIADLNEILAASESTLTHDECLAALKEENGKLFGMLPLSFANQLMLERDPHGNVQVAKIEAERLLIDMVAAQLAIRKKSGKFSGKFSGIPHYLGYEARCALPSNFDANYTYGLGCVAAMLCCSGKTGYIATLSDLTKEPEAWIPAGYPLTMMMNIERRHGKNVAVIKKMLVDLEGAPFTAFAQGRDGWRVTDSYRTPGAAQFSGPCADVCTLSLTLDSMQKTQ